MERNSHILILYKAQGEGTVVEKFDILEDIATRTNGDIYLGVVGPVRTGKSTFIKKFMEKIYILRVTVQLMLFEKRRLEKEIFSFWNGLSGSMVVIS